MKRISWLAVILMLAGRAAAADGPDVSSLRKQAAADFVDKRYEEASEIYARAVALKPSDTDLRMHLLEALSYAKRDEVNADIQRQAVAEFRNGRFTQSADLYAGAAALTPDDTSVLKDWMWALWGAKRYDEAANVASRVLVLHKDDEEAVRVQVRALYYAGHTEDAYQLYTKSHYSLDGMIPLRRSMVHVYENLREYDKAVALCRELLRIQPKDAVLFAAIGRSRFYQGRYDEALAAWRSAVELDPANPRYKVFEARSLYYAGQESAAVASLKKIAGADPQNWEAADFLVQSALVAGDTPTVVAVLENGLVHPSPEDEPRLLQLGGLYVGLGRDDKALATFDRAIALYPNSGEALGAKANFLFTRGKYNDAIIVYQNILHQNPSSMDSWAGLADALTASSQTARAVAARQEALNHDPTNPYLILRLAQSLYDNGETVEGRRLLVDWMKANPDERILPILLYHGLAPSSTDPILSSPIHLTSAEFAGQMGALKKAGFKTITTQQAVDWFDGKSEIPEKSVLITFDDDRLDSFRYADPILKQYGFKAAMMTPVYNVESNPPGFASWNEISTYTSTGRWEIQAHGDQAHNMIKMDKEGHLRLFLTHKRWLDEKGRLETLDEWQDRIAADHESAKTKIRAHVGTVPVAFAYPEGDYGQVGTPNFLQSATMNRGSLCVQYYSICYTQDDIGLNVRSRDHALISRVEPQQSWTPEHLMRLISDRSAFVQMRQQLLLWDAWDGHPRAAYNWLELNRRAGVSKPLMLVSEAQIQFTTGDHDQGLQLAQQALTLDPTLDNQLLVQSMTQGFNHDWAPSLTFFRDSHTRQNIMFEQSVGSLEFHGILMRALQGYSNYRESGVAPVDDASAGVELKRNMGLGQTLSLQSAGHFLSGQAHNVLSVDGDFTSDWSSSLQTEASAGRNPYGMARALDANIIDQFVDMKGSVGTEEKGKASAELRLADPSDNNQRFTATVGALWPFALDGQIRVVGKFTADSTRFVSPNYYSPQHLYMNQIGLGYLAHINDSLKIDLSYLPGYGIEQGTTDSYVQDVELDLQWDWHRKLQVRPSILLSSTPNYHSETYSLVVVRQF